MRKILKRWKRWSYICKSVEIKETESISLVNEKAMRSLITGFRLREKLQCSTILTPATSQEVLVRERERFLVLRNDWTSVLTGNLKSTNGLVFLNSFSSHRSHPSTPASYSLFLKISKRERAKWKPLEWSGRAEEAPGVGGVTVMPAPGKGRNIWSHRNRGERQTYQWCWVPCLQPSECCCYLWRYVIQEKSKAEEKRTVVGIGVACVPPLMYSKAILLAQAVEIVGKQIAHWCKAKERGPSSSCGQSH